LLLSIIAILAHEHHCLRSQVIAIIDTNHDGQISKTEFLRSTAHMKNTESAALQAQKAQEARQAREAQQARDAQQADEDLTDEDTCV
jgi:hypothetical protein